MYIYIHIYIYTYISPKVCIIKIKYKNFGGWPPTPPIASHCLPLPPIASLIYTISK